mgnify:CR=1 FL=1
MSYQANREVKGGLRREQGRLIAQNEDLTIRDVAESRIIVKLVLWFLNQPVSLRDDILGDMKAAPAESEAETAEV